MVASSIWFGLGAFAFFVGVATFVAFAVLRGEITSPYYLLPPMHALIAGTAYVVMALVASGTIPILEVDMVRYADWTLSTPIITYYLAMLAGARANLKIGAVLMNVLMIVAGYVSTVLAGPAQWAMFLFSSLMFAGLIYLYFSAFSAAIEQNPDSSRSLFLSLRDLTIAIWSLYPIVYLIGPNAFALLTVADHSFVTMFLDITAKLGFMAVMLTRQYELNTFVAAETTASPN